MRELLQVRPALHGASFRIMHFLGSLLNKLFVLFTTHEAMHLAHGLPRHFLMRPEPRLKQTGYGVDCGNGNSTALC